MNEFHDGILLFDISGKKVWNKASNDSTGLKKYYEDNRNKFLTKEGMTAKIYTLKKSDGMKSLAKIFKEYSGYPDADKRMLKKFNIRNDTLLTIKEVTWYKGDNKTIDNLSRSKMQQETLIDGFPAIVVINKIIESVPRPFNEVQGEMIAGYQEYLEENWIRQLKGKYTVKIDKEVLEEIKKNLNNE
jgi:peptidyl-prolyl cis-trans isomerase SurA